jgi:hypothetical protein
MQNLEAFQKYLCVVALNYWSQQVDYDKVGKQGDCFPVWRENN